ncbi:MAG: hypothetical protein KBE77_05880 [Aliarcobacter sp.]|nr:hypothetical protein [Aliarcobacter sp.]
MKKLILTILITTLNLLAMTPPIQASYAIGVFHENGSGEKVQHKKITEENYDGTCFSKIVVLGKIQNRNIQVRIGDSLGYFQNSAPVYNAKNIKIGEELTFMHYNVSKGYFEVKIDGRIYDSKVFVK